MSPRARLTRDQVVDAALVVLDRDGLAGLSMRKLAAELGVEAMSLYNHVRDKADLLDGVVDRVLGASTPPDPALPWRERLAAVATGLYGALVAHPPLVLVLASEQGRPTSGAVLHGMDAVLGALAEAGLPPAQQVSAFRGLLALVFGFALTHTRGLAVTRAAAEAIWQQQAPGPVGALPHHARLGEQFLVTRPEDDLAFLLGAYLDAVERGGADRR